MKELQFKNIHTIPEHIEIENDKGVVQIYVSSFGNIDSDNDVIQKGAFTKTIRENIKRIKHFYNHRTDQLIGLPIEMIETQQGLQVTSAMNIEKDFVKDIFSDYKFFAENGRTLEHSIGFYPIQEKYDSVSKANLITEIKLYEYSTLSFLGANENTPLIDLKSLEKMLNYNYTNTRKKQIESILNQAVKENTLEIKPVFDHKEFINLLNKKFQ